MPTESFEVKAVAWDEFLGGHDFDTRIAKMIAEQFDEKNSKLMDGQSVFESPRTMARLLKEAERYKVVLSANEFTPINVEALTNDIDFKSELSREDFETMCSDLLQQSLHQAFLTDSCIQTSVIELGFGDESLYWSA